jgi:hypothetical protein
MLNMPPFRLKSAAPNVSLSWVGTWLAATRVSFDYSSVNFELVLFAVNVAAAGLGERRSISRQTFAMALYFREDGTLADWKPHCRSREGDRFGRTLRQSRIRWRVERPPEATWILGYVSAEGGKQIT